MVISLVKLGALLLAELALIVVLLRTHSYRLLPTFFLYVCWGLVSDAGLYVASIHLSYEAYFRLYLAQLVVDSVILFAVLVELAWSLLRPIRSALPKYAWLGLAGLIAVACLLLWPVAGWAAPAHLTSEGRFFIQLQQTVAILRVVMFLAMAGCSQLLSIGWRDRELQLATGLGLYSLVSFAVAALHAHQMIGPQYHWLDVLDSSSYLAVLFYWCVSFASKEVERQEFSPRMRDFLLAAAGTARTTRVALAQSSVPKPFDRNR